MKIVKHSPYCNDSTNFDAVPRNHHHEHLVLLCPNELKFLSLSPKSSLPKRPKPPRTSSDAKTTIRCSGCRRESASLASKKPTIKSASRSTPIRTTPQMPTRPSRESTRRCQYCLTPTNDGTTTSLATQTRTSGVKTQVAAEVNSTPGTDMETSRTSTTPSSCRPKSSSISCSLATSRGVETSVPTNSSDNRDVRTRKRTLVRFSGSSYQCFCSCSSLSPHPFSLGALFKTALAIIIPYNAHITLKRSLSRTD